MVSRAGASCQSGSESWMTGQSDFREVIQRAVCKPAVLKQRWKRRLERYQHFPPFLPVANPIVRSPIYQPVLG